MGRNHAVAFAHLDVSKGTAYQAPPTAFTIMRPGVEGYAPGHYLYDPSSPSDPPEWMIRSIDEHGLKQAIKCVTDGDRIFVSEGRTRVMAGVVANERRAKRGDPPRIFQYSLEDQRATDEQIAEGITVENLHRRDSGPVAQALEIAKYQARGYPDAKIAGLARCSVRDLDGLAAINRVAPDVRELIRDGKLDWRHTKDIAELPRSEQRAKALELGATKPGAKAARILKGEAAKKSKSSAVPAKKLGRVIAALDGIPHHPRVDDFMNALLFAATGKLPAWIWNDPGVRDAITAALAPGKPGRPAGKKA